MPSNKQDSITQDSNKRPQEGTESSPLSDLSTLDLGDTESLLKLLNEFILQSYKVEKEFKDFKALIELVLEMIPQAVLVFNEDDGSLFYQNKKAASLKQLSSMDFNLESESEIKLDSSIYLLQSSRVSNKVIITATNITEQKRQERLASMGQVSAHLAHEIRNPIGSISLLASVLEKRVDSNSAKIVEEMKKSIWRVERIIKSTLLFSKGVQANIKPCLVKDLQAQMQTIINEYAYSKNINFSFNLNEIEQIQVDISLFEIALQNLICNAIDAIEECEEIESGQRVGEVNIELFEENGFYVFRIYDNGKDIEDLASLFEAFKTTKLKGHGLGLALSEQILKAHNGFLSANNIKKKYFELKIPTKPLSNLD
ncbi:ATP-binding protein [Helicobacter sp. 11S02629-2]|uniref:sensor histidine kinase n=1 Tax=Helicobacter sp. 11S02629-2 TaxID=1476195 RepID=UPI000BA52428|nr:ATP-binding protein [Helicobacter sp. 11S02629-2]PAF42900.1 two-component sensor histidine kinase [Helicobacter sp. 11S02629-2]